ncbi:Permease of the drug/metabolite transporter (DMT) superfamily [Caenispirillum salinarum AK4]|uniref:Permease of the drug/metabolite transporter (DMT) superfamily n=1 Tax=Caenispirillum salinarum AK4 TaxID=1238182 RepID=K9H8B2_9PROT|nr:DMT family transporter [Caenispirillum salinarum]EKV26853.1 Permease of the drug/metabolite transporter (DMT) superfamily [Caenispirillum salinarum AK4]
MPRLSPLLIALAAMFWGLAGGLGGLLMAAGWAPLTVTFHRAAFGLICVALWLAWNRHGPRSSGTLAGLLGWSLVAGAGVAVNFTFYFLAIRETGVAVAATLMYSAPAFVFLSAVLCRIERPTLPKALAVAAVTAGVVLLTEVHRTDGSVTLWGVAFGLLAGVSYAVFIFSFQAAAQRGPVPLVLSIALATVVVALLPLVELEAVAAALVSESWPLFILLGVLGAGLSFALYVAGVRHTPPTIASVLAMVEPVTAATFGVLALGETLSPVQLTGMAVILVTATLLSRAQSA